MKSDNTKVSARRVVITSLSVNIVDILVNTFVALLSGSAVMFSEAFEGLADFTATVFLLVGVNRSNKPADRKHPFGYGREIYFWAFIAALFTFTITACLSFYFGLMRFLNPEPIDNLTLAYLVLSISIATNGYSFSLGSRRLVGKRNFRVIKDMFTNSALIETKTTLILDLMGTLAAVLGLIALILYGITGDSRFDGLGAMAIGLTLAVLALFIIEGARDLLIGRSASPEVEKEILKATKSFPQVSKVLDLRTLHLGNEKLLVNMEVNLDNGLTTDEIEVLIDKIEAKIIKKVPSAKNIQIELESPNV